MGYESIVPQRGAGPIPKMYGINKHPIEEKEGNTNRLRDARETVEGRGKAGEKGRRFQ